MGTTRPRVATSAGVRNSTKPPCGDTRTVDFPAPAPAPRDSPRLHSPTDDRRIETLFVTSSASSVPYHIGVVNQARGSPGAQGESGRTPVSTLHTSPAGQSSGSSNRLTKHMASWSDKAEILIARTIPSGASALAPAAELLHRGAHSQGRCFA